MKLPEYWSRHLDPVGGLVYRAKISGDSLEVRRFKGNPHWYLLVNGKNTSHEFRTAAEAVEHATDAAIHGH